MKKETIYSIGMIVFVIIVSVGVGFLVLKEVSDIPFKLCQNKTGLVIDPEQDYIWYDCDKVNNITVSLSKLN